MSRISALDNLKGILILFVIIGHLPISDFLFKLIYSFHIPLFFFISGFLFKSDLTIRGFLLKKINGIIKPYLLFSGFTYILHLFFTYFTKSEKVSVPDFFISVLKGTAINGLAWNPPLWFLPCLFSLSLIFYFIFKFTLLKNFYIKVIFMFSLGIILAINYINLPFGITQAFMALPFFFVGFLFKSRFSIEKLSEKFGKLHILLGIIIAILLILINPKPINFALNTYGYLPLSYLTAFCIIAVFLRFSNIFEFNLLSLIGRNSLYCFSLHVFTNAICKNIFKFLKVENFLHVNILAFCMGLLSLFFLYLSIIVIRKNNFLKSTLFISD